MKCKLLLMLFGSLLYTSSAFAQVNITGTVTDAETGELLPGVNVFIQELQRGDATDLDGIFEIENVQSGDYTLVATFIGYDSYQSPISVGSSDINLSIELSQAVAMFDDVVVTAFGIQRERRALGYGVSSVDPESVLNRSEADITRALKGQLPGVSIQSSGGLTGSGTDITIRGFSTLTGSNDPLFIVDGVTFFGGSNRTNGAFTGGGIQTTPNRTLDIDPNNIADITVLKGLSAAVLYGEEGRNGVIIITTKGGGLQTGEQTTPGFQVTFDQSVYATQISSRPNYQNTYGGGFDQNFGWFFSNWGPKFSERDPAIFGSNFRGYDSDGTVLTRHPLTNHGPTAAAFPELADVGYRYEAKPDPIGAFFETGLASNTSFNISGGVQDLRLNVNYARSDESGFTPNNTLTRDAFSVGATYKISERFTGQTTFNLSLTDVQSPPSSAGGGSGPAAVGGTAGVLGYVMFTPRNIDLDIPFQNPVTGGSAYYRGGNDIPNPRWIVENVRTLNNNKRIFGKTELGFQINENLNLIYRLGYDSGNETQEYRQNPGGVDPTDLNTGFLQNIEVSGTTYDNIFNFLYDYQLTEDLSLTGTIGAQYKTEKTQRSGIESRDMIIFNFFNHSNFQNPSSTNFFNGNTFQRLVERETAGVFAEATLGYQDVIYLNVAGRNDWFSTLEPDNRSIFYPSVSLSYIASDHLDITSDFLSYLKLFAGLGTSAGSPGAYSTRNVLASDARAFSTLGGDLVTTNATSSFLGNPNLKAELHTEYEFGIDARFFDNRVGLEASYYTKTTEDLITQAPLDPGTGFTSTFVNIGEIQNDGLEVTLRGTPLRGNFQWDVAANFFAYKTTVNELGQDLERIQVGGGFTTRGNFAIPGRPFMTMLGSKIVRVTDELKQGDSRFSNVAVGTPIINSNGDYIPTDEIGEIGNPHPEFELSLINTLRYKNASLSFQFDYQEGGDMFSVWISTLMARGLTKDTDTVDRNNSFILPGVSEDGSANNVMISPSDVFFTNFGFGPDELRVYDMTHIRLANVALTYDLPAALIDATPFSRVSVSITGDNLWMYAFNVPEHSGFDPNVNSIGGNSRGFDYLTGPAARRFGGSIRVSL